jgi:hypothetical protein
MTQPLRFPAFPTPDKWVNFTSRVLHNRLREVWARDPELWDITVPAYLSDARKSYEAKRGF